MTTYSSPNKFSDAPEVASYDGIEVPRSGKYNTSEIASYDGIEIPRSAKYNTPVEEKSRGGPFEQTQPPPSRPRTICGLRRTTFFLALALATVVVLAAAIGGGVGASACSSSSSDKNVVGNGITPISTVTVTSTMTMSSATQSSTLSSAPSATPTITTSCPFSNNTVYQSLFKSGSNGSPGPNAGLDYVVYCNMNFASGLGPHLAQVYAISFNDCIEACASYNFWGDTTDCEQVAYKLDGGRPGNCWIGTKNASEELTFETSPLDIAFLQ